MPKTQVSARLQTLHSGVVSFLKARAQAGYHVWTGLYMMFLCSSILSSRIFIPLSLPILGWMDSQTATLRANSGSMTCAGLYIYIFYIYCILESVADVL